MFSIPISKCSYVSFSGPNDFCWKHCFQRCDAPRTVAHFAAMLLSFLILCALLSYFCCRPSATLPGWLEVGFGWICICPYPEEDDFCRGSPSLKSVHTDFVFVIFPFLYFIHWDHRDPWGKIRDVSFKLLRKESVQIFIHLLPQVLPYKNIRKEGNMQSLWWNV